MAAITSASISLGVAGYQAYQGYENKKKAQNAIDNYNRQDLDKSNPYENMQISTVGSDLMREENQRNTANIVDAMRNGGSRGIAMLPGVVSANNQANEAGRAYLDDQMIKRNYAIAGDKTAIRGMKEERENADLAGLGQQLQTGRQDMFSGFRGIASSAIYGANNIDWSRKRPDIQPIDRLAPIGVQGMNKVNPQITAQGFPSNKNYYDDLSNIPFYSNYSPK